MTAPEIRAMAHDDIEGVVALEKVIYPQPWSDQVFRDELAQESRTYLVAMIEGDVVGYAGLMEVETDAHITTIAVSESVRRHRVGSHLMLALVDHALGSSCDHLTLEVRASNQGAQRMYTRFGLAPVGVRKNYYRNEDAVIMWANDIRSEEYSARIETIRTDLSISKENV